MSQRLRLRAVWAACSTLALAHAREAGVIRW